MVGTPMAWNWWWRASLHHLHFGDWHRGNQGWEALQHWSERPVPRGMDVNSASPMPVHLQGGTGLPEGQEGLAMAFPAGSHWPTGLTLTGAEVAFYLFVFPLSWKLVKDSVEAALDTSGEMTWDTERGHQPPQGGFDELPGRDHNMPAPEHHPPPSHHTWGWQRS